jgi:hypothetical protein
MLKNMSVRLWSTGIKITNPCITCLNYIPYKYTDPYEELYDYSNTNIGTCSKFGIPNYVTGEIEYENAKLCRILTNKCGKDGKYYFPV